VREAARAPITRVASSRAKIHKRWRFTDGRRILRHAHVDHQPGSPVETLIAGPHSVDVEALYTILWGLTSIATVLVKTATSFYLLRFLLGAFEAGLLPGAALGTHDHRRG